MNGGKSAPSARGLYPTLEPGSKASSDNVICLTSLGTKSRPGHRGIGGRVDRAPSHAATWNSCRPLFQFGTVALDPAPDCRVVRFQAALAEQLFDIAQRERVPKVPAHGAKNQLRLRLSPLGDRRSDCLLHDLFRLPATVGQSCNTTHQIAERVRPRRIQYSLTAQCETTGGGRRLD